MTLTQIPRDVTANDLAATCGIPQRTARRWVAQGRAPYAVIIAYQLLRYGDLGALSSAWRGWTLKQDQLWSPENWSHRPNEIRALPITEQLVKELRRQLSIPGPVRLPFGD